MRERHSLSPPGPADVTERGTDKTEHAACRGRHAGDMGRYGVLYIDTIGQLTRIGGVKLSRSVLDDQQPAYVI